MDTLIRCEHLKKTYRNGVTAVQDFTAQFVSGAFYLITGASGAGKSTLLHLLGLLERPTEGVLSLCGNEISAMREGRASQPVYRICFSILLSASQFKRFGKRDGPDADSSGNSSLSTEAACGKPA